MTDIRQSDRYANYLKLIGWEVHRIHSTFYFLRRILTFKVIKIQRPNVVSQSLIKDILIRHKPFQIIIEPNDTKQLILLKRMGFKLSNWPYLPTKSLILSLSGNKTELLSKLKKDARYSLNKTKDLKLLKVKNLNSFKDAWKASVDGKRTILSKKDLHALRKSFNTTSLFLASHNYSAGAIFLIAGNTCYYWQAYTNNLGRTSLAQYKILWEGILWAKEKGIRYFDFEGIYDERFPNRSWVGFTHFKKSFGGKEIRYPGCFSKYYFQNLF